MSGKRLRIYRVPKDMIEDGFFQVTTLCRDVIASSDHQHKDYRYYKCFSPEFDMVNEAELIPIFDLNGVQVG